MRSILRVFAMLLVSFAVVLPLSRPAAGGTAPEINPGHLPELATIQKSVQYEINLLTKNCAECSFYVTSGRIAQATDERVDAALVYVRYPGFYHRVMRLKRANYDVIFILWPLGIRDTEFEKFLSRGSK